MAGHLPNSYDYIEYNSGTIRWWNARLLWRRVTRGAVVSPLFDTAGQPYSHIQCYDYIHSRFCHCFTTIQPLVLLLLLLLGRFLHLTPEHCPRTLLYDSELKFNSDDRVVLGCCLPTEDRAYIPFHLGTAVASPSRLQWRYSINTSRNLSNEQLSSIVYRPFLAASIFLPSKCRPSSQVTITHGQRRYGPGSGHWLADERDMK